MRKAKIKLNEKTKEDIINILHECKVQLEYLDSIYPTGTTPAVLARLQTFIQEYEKEKNEDN